VDVYVVVMASSCDPSRPAVGGPVRAALSTPVTASGRTNWMERLLNAVAVHAHGGSGRDVSSGAVGSHTGVMTNVSAPTDGVTGWGGCTHRGARRTGTRRSACAMGGCKRRGGIGSVNSSISRDSSRALIHGGVSRERPVRGRTCQGTRSGDSR
jgi:hypothetical protein